MFHKDNLYTLNRDLHSFPEIYVWNQSGFLQDEVAIPVIVEVDRQYLWCRDVESSAATQQRGRNLSWTCIWSGKHQRHLLKMLLDQFFERRIEKTRCCWINFKAETLFNWDFLAFTDVFYGLVYRKRRNVPLPCHETSQNLGQDKTRQHQF